MVQRKNGKSGEPRIGKAERALAGRILSEPSKGHGTSHREVWHVNSGGERHTYVTSSRSVRAMDEAVRLYDCALKRLASR